MSGGVPGASIFDESKNYRQVIVVPGTYLTDFDYNEIQEILAFFLRKSISEMGFMTRLAFGDGILKTRDNRSNRPGDGFYDFEFIASGRVKWRKNEGSWNDNGGTGYSVIVDGSTWNEDVGSSGIDLVFQSTADMGTSGRAVVSDARRFFGFEVKYEGQLYEVTVKPGAMHVHGYRVPNDSNIVLVIPQSPATHYVYVDIWLSTIEYTQDYDFGHWNTGKGSYDEPSPDRLKLNWQAKQVSAMPSVPSGHFHVPLAKVTDMGGGAMGVSLYTEEVHGHHWNLAQLEQITQTMIDAFSSGSAFEGGGIIYADSLKQAFDTDGSVDGWGSGTENCYKESTQAWGTKVRVPYYKRTGDKYIKLRVEAKTTTDPGQVGLRINGGTVSAATVGTTAWGSFYDLQVDISGISVGGFVEIEFLLTSATPTQETMYARKVMIWATKE